MRFGTSAALAALTALLLIPGPASAVLVTEHTDSDINTGANVNGMIDGGEYNGYVYTGGNSGFGGILGGGTIYAESDATNLYLGVDVGSLAGSPNNNVLTIYLDTKSGGFSDDTQLTDFGDNGRFIASSITRDSTDSFPVDADYALQFGFNYSVVFELNALSSHGTVTHSFSGSDGGDREVSIALSDLGLSMGDTVDFFAVLTNTDGFASDEGIPPPSFTGNPGFGASGGTVNWDNNHRFVVAAVPEVSPALALPLLLGGFFAVRTLRRRPARTGDLG